MGVFACIWRWFSCDKIILCRDSKIEQLINELETYNHQIDYSFVNMAWKEICGPVTTSKYEQDGIKLNLDIRDLLTSTIYSRKYADQIIRDTTIEDNNMTEIFDTLHSDRKFMVLAIATANFVIQHITYKTNKAQFNVMDRWNNGDTALETKQGDCDLSARCFVRILNDVLDKLKMFEYKKYVFQAIGMWNKSGHSWAMVFNPVSNEFVLIECTRDRPYNELPEYPLEDYKLYFVLNFKRIYSQRHNWENFL